MNESKQGELITEDEPQRIEEAQKRSLAAVVDRDDCGEFELIPADEFKRMTHLSNFVRKSRAQLDQLNRDGDNATAAIVEAGLLEQLEKAISGPTLDRICRLAGSVNGFRTDRDDDQPYDKRTIQQFAITALASGLRLVGNECNLFQRQCYITKEGFEAKLHRECGGMTDFRMQLSAPDFVWSGQTGKGVRKGTAYVAGTVSWKIDEHLDRIEFHKTEQGDFRIPIKCYDTDQDANIIGKAERQVFRRVYKRITGSEMTVGVESADDREETPPPMSKPKTVDIGELLDQLEDGLNPKLVPAKTIKEVDDAEEKAIAWLKTVDNVPDVTFEHAEQHVKDLCEARRDDIRAKRKS